MNPILLALLVGLLFGLFLSFKFFSKPLERQRITSYEFPEGWWKLLSQKIPISFELAQNSRQKLTSDIQWALADKDFFNLEGKELEGLQCVLICAPFILFELHSSPHPLRGVRRFLVLGEGHSSHQLALEDKHDFTLRFSRLSLQVQHPILGKLSSKSSKVLTQIFGEKLAQSFGAPSFVQAYFKKYKKGEYTKTCDFLISVLKTEFYLPEQIDEEEIIGKIHEIFCYFPNELRKALPKTYQGLRQHYQL